MDFFLANKLTLTKILPRKFLLYLGKTYIELGIVILAEVLINMGLYLILCKLNVFLLLVQILNLLMIQIIFLVMFKLEDLFHLFGTLLPPLFNLNLFLYMTI